MLLKDKVDLWWERFHGRRDVYGTIRTKINPETRKPKKKVYPSFLPQFMDESSRKDKEFSSPSELYEPLTKKEVEDHIEGRRELMIYTPNTDGTIRFATVDFDFLHGFEETVRVSKALSHHKIPHAIARSTTKGHHIYVFFDGPIQAYFITNYFNHLFEELGYKERLNNDHRCADGSKWTNPEMFPKQTKIVAAHNLGSGIKPALNSMAMENDQCCWVDINNNVIGGTAKSNAQWEYFKSIELVNPDKFITFITEELNLLIEEDLKLSTTRGSVRDYARSLPYESPEDGDLMLVIKQCPALRRMWEGPNSDLTHNHRLALLAYALRCKNGLDIIRDRFGHSEHTEKEIRYAIDSNQHPWSCATMQSYDICLKGRDPRKASGNYQNNKGEVDTDFCFDKIPPRQTINGKIKINPDNLPESEWPSPSPIRLKNPFTRTGLEGLKQEILGINKDDADLLDKLSVVCRKIVMLTDAKHRDEILTFLKSRKLTTAANIKQFIKEGNSEKKEQAERNLSSMDGFRISNDIRYSTIEGDGYSTVRLNSEGDDEFFTISNFEIEFTMDKTVYPVIGEPERQFIGSIKCEGKTHSFRINAEDYSNNAKLSAAIFSAAGTDADFNPSNLNYIRAAIKLFGTEKMKKIRSYEDYGFDSAKLPQVYRTTTGNITEQGFVDKDDTNTVVDLSQVPFARYLGLNEISKPEFIEAVDIIKKNILTMQESTMTYTTIAHSFQAVIHNVYVPFKESPILWMTGTTGVGKSEMGIMAQAFHGTFGDKALTIQSTVRSMDQYTMMFKDTLLVIDDYKAHLTPDKVIKPLIQKIYDRSERARLGMNLKHSGTVTSRGLVMFTGEDVPTSEASIIARLIYVNTDNKLKGNQAEAENLRKVKSAFHLLPGVTSRFIQYMLQTYPAPITVHEKFYGLQNALSHGLASVAKGKKLNNAPRVVNNLAGNYLAWELMLEFFHAEGAISMQELEEYRAQHWNNVLHLRKEILERCFDEQASNVFLDTLRQLILSGRYRIDGIGSSEDSRAEVVGYCDDAKKGTVYLFPKIAYNAVQRNVRDSGSTFTHGRDSVGKQLFEDGLMTKTNKGLNSLRKHYKGSRVYVWAIDGVKAGLGVTLREVDSDGDVTEIQEEVPKSDVGHEKGMNDVLGMM